MSSSMRVMLRTSILASSICLLASVVHAGDQGDPTPSCDAQRLWIQYRDANCLYYGMGEGTIAGIDAGECMRNMTQARARELEGLGHK